MSNMTYARFQNTLKDLRDCYENMDNDPEELSDEEKRSRKRLIELCKKIASDYGKEE